jgi:hypothetical protein
MGATELALDATGTLLMISDSYEEPFIIFSREKGSQGKGVSLIDSLIDNETATLRSLRVLRELCGKTRSFSVLLCALCG